jgi:hypothetical protein
MQLPVNNVMGLGARIALFEPMRLFVAPVLAFLATAGCDGTEQLDSIYLEGCEYTCGGCVPVGAEAAAEVEVDGMKEEVVFTCVNPYGSRCWTAETEWPYVSGAPDHVTQDALPENFSQWKCRYPEQCQRLLQQGLEEIGMCEELDFEDFTPRDAYDAITGDVEARCKALDILFAHPNMAALAQRLERPAFYLGGLWAVGSANSDVTGADLVFDLWNHEVAVLSYAGNANTVRLAGLEGDLYAGFGFGMDNGLDDWSGRFVSVQAEAALPTPIISGSIGLGVFSSAPPGMDEHRFSELAALVEGQISLGDIFRSLGNLGNLDDVLEIDLNLIGIFASVSVSADLLALFGNLPVNGTISDGVWRHDAGATRFFDKFFGRVGTEETAKGYLRFVGDQRGLDFFDVLGGVGNLLGLRIGEHTRAGLRMAVGMKLLDPLPGVVDAPAFMSVLLGYARDQGFEGIYDFYDTNCRWR